MNPRNRTDSEEQPQGLHRLSSPGLLAGVLLLHAVLAVAMRMASAVSMIHAILTLVVGVGAAAFARKPEYAAYAAGYVASCEVLWRMTRGTLVWEHGKYALLAILLTAIIRFRKVGQPIAFVQFLLLLPSAFLPIAALSLDQVRDALSFNLSGPFALCASVLFMAGLRWTASQLYDLLVIMVCPLFGVAVITVYNMGTAANLKFNGASNYLVTGGFGPNQVSAALGLGVMLAFILVTSAPMKALAKTFLIGALFLMVAQCFMTFSRNGMYSSIIACFAGAPFLISDPKIRSRILLGVPVLVLVFALVVFPILDNITDGKLSDRFQNTEGSHREDIVSREFEIWMANFVMGVGPGMGMYLRGDLWDAAAHTEFSRLLAEHGLLGLGALALYPALFLSAFRDASSRVHKGLVVCCIVWSACFMAANAMRLAAPGFVFGLACVGVSFVAVPPSPQGRRQPESPRPAPAGRVRTERLPFPGVTARAD